MRLRPLTRSIPKCLVKIRAKSLLEYWLDAMLRAGVTKCVVCTHHHAHQIRDRIAALGASVRPRVVESYEPELLGSAGALSRNVDLADGVSDVLVIYADNFSDICLSQFLQFHRSHHLGFTMLLFRAPDPRACGIVRCDRSGTIVHFEEKPEIPSSDLANAGVYAMTAATYREVASLSVRDIARDVVPRLVGRMKGLVHRGYHRDIGTIESLKQACRDMQKGIVCGSQ
ncbi:MAG: nucleotidyltransferase family protein [Acidobacteriota bacterium]